MNDNQSNFRWECHVNFSPQTDNKDNSAFGNSRWLVAIGLIAVLGLPACLGGGGGSESATGTVAVSVAPVVSPGSPITAFASGGPGVVNVSAANTLVIGDVIVISGTTTGLDGTYSVVSATPTGFSVNFAPAFPGTSAGYFQLGGGVIAGCATTGAGAITLSHSASRFSGAAPLAVFFDATASNAAPPTATAYHDLEYSWNFGDPTSGSWTKGSRSGSSLRTVATGPVAAHVYETPGTYTVTLQIKSGSGTVSNSCIQIAVQSPDIVFAGSKTLCVSTSGTFNLGAPNECPAGSDTLTSANFKAAVEAAPATTKRILFRRGETFAAATSAILANTGAGIIGAFGTAAAKPIVTTPAADAALRLSSNATPSFADWRVMDIEFDGLNGANAFGIAANGGFSQITMLRLAVHNVHIGVLFSDGTMDGLNTAVPLSVPLWDQIAIADSSIANIDNGVATGGGYGVYLVAQRFSFMGNFIDNLGGGEHGMRNPYLTKAAITNNTFANAAPSKLVLTVRGPDFVGGHPAYPAGTYTEKLVVADNKFLGGNHQIIVSNGTANPAIDQRQRDEIWERNWFVSGVGTQFAMAFNGTSRTTLRNNVFDLSGGTSHTGVSLSSDATVTVSPANDTFWIYNNTFYSADTDSDFRAVWITLPGTETNIIVKNNIAYSPADTTHAMIFDQSGGTAFAVAPSNNSSDGQVLGTVPAWPLPITTASPSGFRLTAPSYVAADATVPVFSDFLLNPRPNGAAGDIGAFEF
jgi:hypothetical protein